jgi:hypothetical protein
MPQVTPLLIIREPESAIASLRPPDLRKGWSTDVEVYLLAERGFG